jgi:hypothetical protein
MKLRFAKWLRALADLLDPPPDTMLLQVADHLCAFQEKNYPERGGEAKRHQVYAALLKMFPDRTKRNVARAIEAVL